MLASLGLSSPVFSRDCNDISPLPDQRDSPNIQRRGPLTCAEVSPRASSDGLPTCVDPSISQLPGSGRLTTIVTATAAGLLLEPDLVDDHVPIHRLAHV